MTAIVHSHDSSEDLPRSTKAGKVRLRKPWSHGRAYAPIAVIILLVLGSLVWLQLHQLVRKFSKSSTVAKRNAPLVD